VTERGETTTATGADAPAACWSCAALAGDASPFCAACGTVQPPRALDHFARLGLPRGFALDPAALDRAYFALQRLLHPDRFARASARERAISQSQAVALNEAYETLRLPLPRAEYLLRLAGQAIGREPTLRDPELLAEQMERREALAEAATLPALEACVGGAAGDAAALEADLVAAFARGDHALARRATLRLRYLLKLLDEARARRERIAPAA
jgi:molecular chaperone HscB